MLLDDLPFVTGAIGLLGTEPGWDLMQGCDTLLMVGTGFPWSEFLPKDGAARAVQIDIKASMLLLRYRVDVSLHGDAAATLKALLPLIQRKENREWAKTIETNITGWWKKLEGRAKAEANPVNPQRLEALGGSAMDRMCIQQSGPQRSHLGAAGHGGNPRFEASQDIPDFAYAKFGELLGLRGIFVDSPGPGIRMAGGPFERSPCRAGSEDRF
ncbi:hypothetical protein ACVIJW_011384 [Bradyrhizobium barranii subsp. barranii]